MFSACDIARTTTSCNQCRLISPIPRESAMESRGNIGNASSKTLLTFCGQACRGGPTRYCLFSTRKKWVISPGLPTCPALHGAGVHPPIFMMGREGRAVTWHVRRSVALFAARVLYRFCTRDMWAVHVGCIKKQKQKTKK